MRMGERRIISSGVRRWCRGPAGGLALIVVCLSVYLPGIASIPPIDRDESRFAQASRQMFEAAVFPPELKRADFHGGGWAVPMVQDRPRLNKPPLIYWLQVLSAWTFTGGDPLRDQIWMYRVPSVVCSTIAVLLTWWIGRTMFDPRAAWAGAALLAIAPVVVFDAHQARADQLLLATVTATQGCLWLVWKSSRRSHTATPDQRPRATRAWIGFWVCLGLSVLAKGPIGPMIAVLTCAWLGVMSRSWGWLIALRPVRGLLILAVIVAPWVWLVGDHVGWQKYWSIIWDETVGRSLQAKEGHWAPPGYHTVLLAVLFWPGSLMTALGVKRTFMLALRGTSGENHRSRAARMRSAWQSRTTGRDSALFCLGWVVPAWLVFELVGTKLPHYTLPLYPPLALVSARMLLRAAGRGSREIFSPLDRFGFGAWWFMGILVTHGIVAASLLLFASSNSEQTVMMGIAAVVAMMAAVAVWRMRPRSVNEVDLRRVATMALAWMAACGVFTAFIAEHVLPGNLTPRMYTTARAAGGDAALLASEYHEDSLIYASRGLVRRMNRDEIAPWLEGGPGRVAIVRDAGAPFFDDSWDVLPPYVSWGRIKDLVGGWQVITREPGDSVLPNGAVP